MFGFICNIQYFYFFSTHVCFCEIYSYTSLVAVLISWVVPGCDFSMGGWWRHETNICNGTKGQRETVYVLICDSHGSFKSPMGNGEFLYVFFYISHHVCVPCLFQCYALTSEVNFTLRLIFYLSNLFYIPLSTHFTPLMCFFLSCLCTFLFSQVYQMCPYCALYCYVQCMELCITHTKKTSKVQIGNSGFIETKGYFRLRALWSFFFIKISLSEWS